MRTEYTIREGEELVLPCPANGSPAPKIQFSRTGDAGAAGTGFMWTEQTMPRHAVVSQVGFGFNLTECVVYYQHHHRFRHPCVFKQIVICNIRCKPHSQVAHYRNERWGKLTQEKVY